MQLLWEAETADTLLAKLSEATDRAHRCDSARRQAYNMLIAAAGTLAARRADGGTAAVATSSRSDMAPRHRSPRDVVVCCVEDFLDDYKQQAFSSAFVEPARYYYDCVGDSGGRDHVNVHGLNAYLTLLGLAGIVLPLEPEERDA